VLAGHWDRTYETACLISVASIGARGCVVDCFTALIGNEASKVVDMLSEAYLGVKIQSLLRNRHRRIRKEEAR
jgi:hypothetical protein